MKITKAMGRNCILGLGNGRVYNQAIEDSLKAIGWKCRFSARDENILFNDEFRATDGHYMTALAMCAAIAGVKPEGA